MFPGMVVLIKLLGSTKPSQCYHRYKALAEHLQGMALEVVRSSCSSSEVPWPSGCEDFDTAKEKALEFLKVQRWVTGTVVVNINHHSREIMTNKTIGKAMI